LHADASLAGEDIRVMEAGKKIMLRGTVKSEDVKNRAEELAKETAAGIEIDNNLKVEKSK
jgi:osmotically-inducible protein OsmY